MNASFEKRNRHLLIGVLSPQDESLYSMVSAKGEAQMSTSIRYKILKFGIGLMGTKKMFALPKDELLKKAAALNKNRDFRIPKDHKCRYGDREILGQYHCLTMQLGAQKAKRGILFFFGGGMILGPDSGDVKCALQFGQKAEADVWFPYYPLCTDHCIRDTYEMSFECYRQMVAEYGAENISLLGFSSGAALAIGIALHNNALGSSVPMPHQIVACSPGAVPTSEGEWQKMLALNDRDILIDAGFMKTEREIMAQGERVPEYMLSGVRGDFTGLPHFYFYYGSDEVLYAEAEYFAAACKKAGVPYTLTVGEGMCHCYPMVPYFPEGKRAQAEIIEILSH